MKLYCVTNRKLCSVPFLYQFEAIASSGADGMILREKDLTLRKYSQLAYKCQNICKQYQVPLILNTYLETALLLHLPVQLSISQLSALPYDTLTEISFGVSVHSVEEAIFAQEKGAKWIIAGHIFSTDCKKGIPPRGLVFLQNICSNVAIPVFAIGGIRKDSISAIKKTGAAGCCVMSEWMQTKTPIQTLHNWKKYTSNGT